MWHCTHDTGTYTDTFVHSHYNIIHENIQLKHESTFIQIYYLDHLDSVCTSTPNTFFGWVIPDQDMLHKVNQVKVKSSQLSQVTVKSVTSLCHRTAHSKWKDSNPKTLGSIPWWDRLRDSFFWPPSQLLCRLTCLCITPVRLHGTHQNLRAR